MHPQSDITGPGNLLDWLEGLAGSSGERRVTARVLYDAATFDVQLSGWFSPATKETRAILNRMGDAGLRVRSTPSGVLVRFPDEQVARLGARLEGGTTDSLTLGRPADSTRWLVNFASANANKALHVGHLRNVAIGNALASLAEAGGATEVVRQSRVGDYGRNMGEAVAGWLQTAQRCGPAVDLTSRKPDHVIGECYSRYVADKPTSDTPGDGLGRERIVQDDLAEQLLDRWKRGDSMARRLFDEVRSRCVAGQDATLARLGITLDRHLFESDHLPDAEALVAEALARQIALQTEGGATVYPTGDAAYPVVLLVRSDGFPTQNLRYIATWRAIGAHLAADMRTVGVLGAEWAFLSSYTRRLLEALDGPGSVQPAFPVVHGMVTLGAHELHSSGGQALLVDDLLDELVESRQIRALSARAHGADANAVAAIAVLGAVLFPPLAKPISFDSTKLTDCTRNPGWAVAEAWVLSCVTAHDGAPDPAPDDLDYRRAIVRAQQYPRTFARSLEHLDPSPLMRYLSHLSAWYLKAEPNPRVARIVRTLLESGLDALGLFRRRGFVGVSATSGRDA